MTDKTVSHAIERGIDFLFANRRFCGNEPRLWEDLKTRDIHVKAEKVQTCIRDDQ
jgi:hypothetical protein